MDVGRCPASMSAKASGSSILSDESSPSNARLCESFAYCSNTESTFDRYGASSAADAPSGFGSSRSTLTARWPVPAVKARMRPRTTPSTITLMWPFGSFSDCTTDAMTPVSLMSPAAGSSTLGSFCAARKIVFSDDASAVSSAAMDDARPTTKGAIIRGRRPCRAGARAEASGRRTRTARWRWDRSSRFPERQDGSRAAEHDVLRDDALFDLFLRGHAVHDVQHQLLEDDLQAAGADVADIRLFGNLLHRVIREAQVHVLEVEKRLVLLEERVLRLLQDGDESRAVEVVQRGDDRDTPDELRDHSELDHVLGMRLLEDVAGALLFLGDDLRAEAHGPLGEPPPDDVLEAHEGAAADEQDVRRVDLDELLVRVLAAALRGTFVTVPS